MTSNGRARGKGNLVASGKTLGGLAPAELFQPAGRPSRMFQDGDVIADIYRVRGLLGEGGMGQVYDAFDEDLGRSVAVKVAWPDLGSDSLLREARVMAAFNDPGLMTVYAMGEDHGTRYVVMERLYGRTLAAHMAQRRRFGGFSIPEVVHILDGICASTRALHHARLAHGDLKPANLVITSDRLVLLDFGIAHSEQARYGGQISGTPEYISPEAAMDRVKPGEAFLSDLYALGVIGFDLLTGQLPFSGVTPLATLNAHVCDALPDIGALRPDAPHELVSLLESLLAKSPGDRPPSLEVVAATLRILRWELESLRTAPLSVLIAEDDEPMGSALRANIEALIPHSSIYVAADGKQALHRFARMPPDIMLVDLQLPELNGFELAMYLRGTSLADSTQFVIVSAHLREEEQELAKRLGLRHVVKKGPAMYDDLRRVLAPVVATVMHARSAKSRVRRELLPTD